MGNAGILLTAIIVIIIVMILLSKQKRKRQEEEKSAEKRIDVDRIIEEKIKDVMSADKMPQFGSDSEQSEYEGEKGQFIGASPHNNV